MADSKDASVPNTSRLVAQRNATFAASFFLTAVIVCAGWALETIPRREAAADRREILALRQGLSKTERALRDAESALRQTEKALIRTEDALKQARRGPG